jgi:hypothetical protein
VEKHKGFHDNSPSPLYSENDEKRKKWTVIYRIMHSFSAIWPEPKRKNHYWICKVPIVKKSS